MLQAIPPLVLMLSKTAGQGQKHRQHWKVRPEDVAIKNKERSKEEERRMGNGPHLAAIFIGRAIILHVVIYLIVCNL